MFHIFLKIRIGHKHVQYQTLPKDVQVHYLKHIQHIPYEISYTRSKKGRVFWQLASNFKHLVEGMLFYFCIRL